jgi:glucose-6-phosphate 1-dehydrogenase
VTDADNPLLEGLQLRRTPEPCALVIYGATGDLTKRKLLPAIYALALRQTDAADVESVAVDGVPVPPPAAGRLSASDELSRELDAHGRDAVYEQALASVR